VPFVGGLLAYLLLTRQVRNMRRENLPPVDTATSEPELS
jgi:hypothetical protein